MGNTVILFFTLGKGDVLIAISNSGESDKVLEAVKIANRNGGYDFRYY